MDFWDFGVPKSQLYNSTAAAKKFWQSSKNLRVKVNRVVNEMLSKAPTKHPQLYYGQNTGSVCLA